jgi:hypothetical protein
MALKLSLKSPSDKKGASVNSSVYKITKNEVLVYVQILDEVIVSMYLMYTNSYVVLTI